MGQAIVGPAIDADEPTAWRHSFEATMGSPAHRDGIGTAGGAPKRAWSSNGAPNWVQTPAASQDPPQRTMVRARADYFRQVTSRSDGDGRTVVPHKHNSTWPNNDGCKLDAEIRSTFGKRALFDATGCSPIRKHSTHQEIYSVGGCRDRCPLPTALTLSVQGGSTGHGAWTALWVCLTSDVPYQAARKV